MIDIHTDQHKIYSMGTPHWSPATQPHAQQAVDHGQHKVYSMLTPVHRNIKITRWIKATVTNFRRLSLNQNKLKTNTTTWLLTPHVLFLQLHLPPCMYPQPLSRLHPVIPLVQSPGNLEAIWNVFKHYNKML